MNLLSDLELAEIVARQIFAVSQEMDFSAWGFVIMPNHCHLLCFCREDPYSVSDFLARIKKGSSKECFRLKPNLRRLCVYRRNEREDEYRIWMPGGGFDRNLSDPNAILKSLDYLHQNPVKKGLCDVASEWRFSSASFYETGKSEWPLVRYPE